MNPKKNIYLCLINQIKNNNYEITFETYKHLSKSNLKILN